MKYFKRKKFSTPNKFIISFGILLLIILLLNKKIVGRSLVTITLGSIYVELINTRAELVNFLEGNQIKKVSLTMSPNNFVRIQKERSRMVSNFILNGDLWKGENTYFKSKYLEEDRLTKAEIKLFGMNPDHFRDSDAHSFRIKYDGDYGYGKKKVNFLNPRSRDYITDPLLNIIYDKIFSGIKISYEPVQVFLNKSNYGIFYKEDFFDKYLIEDNRRRESVIFEALNDSLQFNFIGENDEFLDLANQLDLIYKKKYKEFIQKVDHEKLRSVILLSLIINNNHPLLDINMHWYYNPVNGLIEPTIREGFIKKIDKLDLNGLVKENKLIYDVYKENIESNFHNELQNDLNKILNLIKTDKDYYTLKKKMIGFKNKILEKEKLILSNIDIIKTLLPNQDSEKKDLIKIKRIKNDTIIKGEYIIRKEEKLVIEQGAEITLSNAYLKIYGGFNAEGKSDDKILIKGDDYSGSIYFNTDSPVTINNVIFENLTNIKSNQPQPAAITFYESDSINISNSIFSNNLKGDDFVNFFRSNNVNLSSLIFTNVLNDAIDSDFSDLIISDSKFINIGNDAIDGSGSTISINNNTFNNVKDKAISAGENSTFDLKNNLFIANEIAIVSKDGSSLISKNDILRENILDFASFIKKSYYSPPSSEFSNTLINNYLIEEHSNIKGMDSIIYSNNVESKLYGNIYGTSSD